MGFHKTSAHEDISIWQQKVKNAASEFLKVVAEQLAKSTGLRSYYQKLLRVVEMRKMALNGPRYKNNIMICFGLFGFISAIAFFTLIGWPTKFVCYTDIKSNYRCITKKEFDIIPAEDIKEKTGATIETRYLYQKYAWIPLVISIISAITSYRAYYTKQKEN